MKLRDRFLWLINVACDLFPIKKNKIVFSSFQGKYYSDSPKEIFEALRKLNNNYKYIWIMIDPIIPIQGAKVIKQNSLSRIYHMATAKIWIDNCRKPIWTRKRKGQIYIQSWHGGFPFKKSEGEVADKLPEVYIKKASHDSEICDYVLSGCRTNDEFIAKYFWFNNTILKTGIPKTDVFYKDKDSYIKRVFEHYHFDSKTKYILYAPTFRENRETVCYNVNWMKVLETLHDIEKCHWKIVFRLHPNMIEYKKSIKFNDDILDGSEYEDINELIMASYALVTDYSSCLFDAIEAGIPAFVYAFDYGKYRNERGINYPFDELPVLFADTTEQLCNNLRSFDREEFRQKRKDFLHKHGYYNDGQSSDRVASLIVRLIENYSG